MFSMFSQVKGAIWLLIVFAQISETDSLASELNAIIAFTNSYVWNSFIGPPPLGEGVL